MITPTTPSPERQPADAGGERDAFESWYCQDAAKLGLSFSPSELFNLREGEDYGSHLVAINSKWEGWQGRAALSIPAPQAQPDARAVEAILRQHIRCDATGLAPAVASVYLTGFEEAAKAVSLLSAPAADDGWRPSREALIAAIGSADRDYCDLNGEPCCSEEDGRWRAHIADAILALHPAAPTQSAVQTGEVLWMMHVRGPDDIYPAPDYATAVQWCDYVNYELTEGRFKVLLRAVPAFWTGSPESHAEGLADAIAGWTRPALSQPESSQ